MYVVRLIVLMKRIVKLILVKLAEWLAIFQYSHSPL